MNGLKLCSRELKRVAFTLAILLLAASPLSAENMSVRLVEASNNGDATASGLSDVAGLLSASLPFSNFALLHTANVALGGKAMTQLSRGYSLASTGESENLQLVVNREGKELLRTTTSLQPGKPLILGGFGDRERRILLLLLLQ